MRPVMYLVPERIAVALNLDGLRHRVAGSDGSACYVLGAPDLAGYGIEEALRAGSRAISMEEATALCEEKK